jgi:prepilin-type N-terminal cleavage/methylation domain-containing protein
MTNTYQKSAFTLLEMIVVVIIITIVYSLYISKLSNINSVDKKEIKIDNIDDFIEKNKDIDAEYNLKCFINNKCELSKNKKNIESFDMDLTWVTFYDVDDIQNIHKIIYKNDENMVIDYNFNHIIYEKNNIFKTIGLKYGNKEYGSIKEYQESVLNFSDILDENTYEYTKF